MATPFAQTALLSRWRVDYGDGFGEKEVAIPHAWRQDVSVEFEGPVSYFIELPVPRRRSWLLFQAVSYAATIFVDGVEVAKHEGMWDAFSVCLEAYAGKTVSLEVRVIKSGGPTYPVDQVLGGSWPQIYNSFGGIYGDVELVEMESDPLEALPPAGPTRIEVDGSRLRLDGEPFYLRGVLHHGWYPHLGHCRLLVEAFEAEMQTARDLGFNTVRFAGWLPCVQCLAGMDALGMVAWIELPLINPSPLADWDRHALEIERIVRQYRGCRAIIAWSLHPSVAEVAPAGFCSRIVRLVRSLTGCPLVGDGRAGVDGLFDQIENPAALEEASLEASVRRAATIVSGYPEVLAHRDLSRLADEHPFWASTLHEFNAPGVRGKLHLPGILRDSPLAHEPRESGQEELFRSSVGWAAYLRRTGIRRVRSMPGFAGYVVPNWRDLPEHSGGLFDDWGARRVVGGKHKPVCLFLSPSGSHKVVWTGPQNWMIGVHSERALNTSGFWRILRKGAHVAEGSLDLGGVEPLQPVEVGVASAALEEPGLYELRAEYGGASAAWTIMAVDPNWEEADIPVVADLDFIEAALSHPVKAPAGTRVLSRFPEEGRFVYFVTRPGEVGEYNAVRAPEASKSAFVLNPTIDPGGSWAVLDEVAPRYGLISPPELNSASILGKQISLTDYSEYACIVRLRNGAIVTTLWPWGRGGALSPSGVYVLRQLIRLASE